MYADYRKDFAGVQEIDASAAIELVGDPKVVFVDVRDPKEQAVSMIPGAVTSEVFLADPDRYRGQKIIGYCTISYRSGKLAAKMGRKGITIVNLKGGLLAWVHAGGTIVRGYKPVKQLHVYGRKWDLAPVRKIMRSLSPNSGGLSGNKGPCAITVFLHHLWRNVSYPLYAHFN